MTIEITTGFLMFWGGLAGSAISFFGALIYFAASSAKAKKLLKKIDEEDF
ncbi:MAG: hypothetical protein ACI4KA_05560 [Oscillospiraceae bacterium]